MQALIDQPKPTASKPVVNELFHRVNRVIPASQSVLTIDPEVVAEEGLRILEEHGYSQIPVVVGSEVLGLFSYQSFSRAVISFSKQPASSRKLDVLALTVEECMDSKPCFARVTDEFNEWFDAIDRQNAILVGQPSRLQGIVTAMDILRYLDRVASPFVLVGEVERALRMLIQMAVCPDTLADSARECLKMKYGKDEVPVELHKMSFNDYIQIIGDGRFWEYFHPFFGGSRSRTRTRLEQLRDVRNVICHFRRSLNVEEHQSLAANRDWMLRKARIAEARCRGEET